MNFIETIKVVNGNAINLEYHHKRIIRAIGHDIDFKIDIKEPDLLTGKVKYRFLYNSKGIIDVSYIRYNMRNISSLQLVQSNEIDYHQKYENRDCLNKLLKLKKNCDDILIVKNGMVTDSSYCNVVFSNKNGLFTPSNCLLKGTKRAYLIDKGSIIEKDISINDINNYDSLILINAMIDIEDNLKIPRSNIIR